MEWMDWMGGLIVVFVVLFCVWCFDLIGLLLTGDTWWLRRRRRQMKGEPKEKNEK